MTNSKVFLRFFAKFALFLIFTFLLLEIVTRVIWWNGATVALLDKDITLLPKTLVTESQANILEAWSNNVESYEIFDPVLGWSIRPNAVVEKENVVYSSNSIGIRSSREYDLTKPENITRVAAFGPSFTFGDEAGDDAAWPAQLEQACLDLEVMNYGVGGYGTDQSFLRYQTSGVNYQPDIVLIGYEDNNQLRNVNRFRPYYKGPDTNTPLTKPIYIPNNGELILLDNPFAEFDDMYDTLLKHPDRFVEITCPYDFFCDKGLYLSCSLDAFYSFRFLKTLMFEINPNWILTQNDYYSEKYSEEVSLKLLEMFVQEVDRNGAVPVTIFFPQQTKTLSKYENGQRMYYHDFIPAIQNFGGQVIDLNEHFVRAKQTQGYSFEDFFTKGRKGHYSKVGNNIVAQTILDYLCQNGYVKNCCN